MDMDNVEDQDCLNMAYMAYKNYTSLPPPNLKTTPQCPKHATVNLLSSPFRLRSLDSILRVELEGSIISHNDIIDKIYTDEELGFEIAPIAVKLASLQAFDCAEVKAEPTLPGTLPTHHQCNIADEMHTANHLNRITALIGEHVGKTSM